MRAANPVCQRVGLVNRMSAVWRAVSPHEAQDGTSDAGADRLAAAPPPLGDGG